MNKVAIAILAGSLGLAGSTFGEAPAGRSNSQSTSTCCSRCDKDRDGKCDLCGRPVGSGRAQGRGPGRGRMMAMQGGMGRGAGACTMGRGPAAAQPEAAPKPEKK